MTHSDRLYFTRTSLRRTQDDKLQEQLHYIAKRGLGGQRSRGWSYEIGPIQATYEDMSRSWKFTTWIRFYPTKSLDSDREKSRRAEIYSYAQDAGKVARFQSSPWLTVEQDKPLDWSKIQENGEDNSNLIEDEDTPTVDLESLSQIEKGNYFDHLFGLDSQIRILLSAIQAAVDSKRKNRFHSLLYGNPGCGKTDILLSTAKMLSDLHVPYIAVDATSATEAGMRKKLLDEDSITPQVIIIEEIEKAPQESSRYLLGLMDDRGVVQVDNYRKSASRQIEAIVLATANDYQLLSKMMYGALLSRFSNEIYCPRPNREILAKFLHREVTKVNGNLSWIEPTLIYCYDVKNITDPRQLKRVCLCGKDRLLTGEFQKDLDSTMRKEEVIKMDLFTD